MNQIRIDTDIIPALEKTIATISRERPDLVGELQDWITRFRARYQNRVFADIIEFTNNFLTEIRDRDDYCQPTANIAQHVRTAIQDVSTTLILQVSANFTQALPANTPTSSNRVATPEPTVVLEYEQQPLRTRDLSPYIELAMLIGPDATIQTLIAAGVVPQQQSEAALKIIGDFLKPFKGHTPNPVELLSYPPTILQIPTIQEILQILITKKLYQELVEAGVDELEGYDERVQSLPQIIESKLEALFSNNNIHRQPVHDELIKKIMTKWTKYAEWQLPSNMVKTLHYNNKTYPVPSLRQRIAAVEIEDRQHMYLGFAPGLAKTLPVVAAWVKSNEKREAEGLPPGRLLFVCQPRALAELPHRLQPPHGARISHDGYFESEHPSVGVISEAVVDKRGPRSKKPLLSEQLNKDVIFVAATMLGRERDDKTILDHLIKEAEQHENDRPITFVAVDEAHTLNGQKEIPSQVRELLVRLPGTHDNGNIVFMSGTPVTNELSGFNGTLRNLVKSREDLLDDITSKQLPDSRQVNASELRASSLRTLLVLDKPDNWEDHIEERAYELPRRNQRFQQMLIEDDEADMQKKMQDLYLFTINPRLVSGVPNMPWPLLDALKAQLEIDLEESDTVLITESYLKQGVTSAHKDIDENIYPPILAELQAFAQEWAKRKERETGKKVPVHCLAVDGGIKGRPREDAYRQAEESNRTGTSKTILLVNAKCVEDSINLSCFKRQIALEHPFTQPSFEQLVKRSLREGNTEFKATLLYGGGTLHEAIYLHALERSVPIKHLLHGDCMTDDDVYNIGRSEIDEESYVTEGNERSGTRISNHIAHKRRRRSKTRLAQQDKGNQRYRTYWQNQGPSQWLDTYVHGIDAGHNTLTVPDHVIAVSGLVQQLKTEGIIKGNQLLDAHSHAAALQRSLLSTSPTDWEVSNLMFDGAIESEADRLLTAEHQQSVGNCAIGMMHELDAVMPNQRFDAIVWSDGFQFTYPPHENVDTQTPEKRAASLLNKERVQVLMQANKHLIENGVLVIQIPWTACTPAEWRDIAQVVKACGFEVSQAFTGTIESSDNDTDESYKSHVLVATKISTESSEYNRATMERLKYVSATQCTLTTANKWSVDTKKRLGDQPARHKIQQEPLHHEYKINDNKFSCSYRPDVKEKQCKHYEKITGAVNFLRSLAEEGKDLNAIGAEDSAVLRDLGVFYLAVKSSPKNPAFNYCDETDDIEQIIYPLDPKWNA